MQDAVRPDMFCKTTGSETAKGLPNSMSAVMLMTTKSCRHDPVYEGFHNESALMIELLCHVMFWVSSFAREGRRSSPSQEHSFHLGPPAYEWQAGLKAQLVL